MTNAQPNPNLSQGIIPIPPSLEDTKYLMDYSRFEETLSALGFEKIFSVDGLRPSQFKRLCLQDDGRFDTEEENFATWVHPAGVLVFADSYTSGVRARSANSAHVYFNVGLPENEDARTFLNKLPFGISGGFQGHDTDHLVWEATTDAINGKTGIVEVLDSIQQAGGKMLPFEQWRPEKFVYISPSQCHAFHASADDIGLEEKEVVNKHKPDLVKGQMQLVKAAEKFPGLSMVLARRLGGSNLSFQLPDGSDGDTPLAPKDRILGWRGQQATSGDTKTMGTPKLV